jgi:hypothetical protein
MLFWSRSSHRQWKELALFLGCAGVCLCSIVAAWVFYGKAMKGWIGCAVFIGEVGALAAGVEGVNVFKSGVDRGEQMLDS